MKITLDVFNALSLYYRFHPGFLDLILGMGYKSSPEDEHFMSCYTGLQSDGTESEDSNPKYAGRVQ